MSNFDENKLRSITIIDTLHTGMDRAVDYEITFIPYPIA